MVLSNFHRYLPGLYYHISTYNTIILFPQSRYKEEQDTEDLDRMVKKVEKKLERSEARAAEAEAELQRTRQYQTTSDTDKIAWEISQSADSAEKLVKQMCSGIEDLRRIASNLAGKPSR